MPRPWVVPLLAALLLVIQGSLAVLSLVQENPTIDEVAHLPAGVTYWQTGSFRLYPHNPPLVKLLAALPVVWAGPSMERAYERPSWRNEPPLHPSFAHEFAVDNAARYFELFTRARLLMPVFAILGGLAVFLWSRALWGPWGGLLSLALWTFCPNILAHGRLVTTDVGATSLGVLATFLFWRYLKVPGWVRATATGLALGLALLAKFSSLLLFGVWPLLWLVDQARRGRSGWLQRLGRAAGHGALVVSLAVLVIDAGYGLEGLFRPLGSFAFTSGSLTRPRQPGDGPPPTTGNGLLDLAHRHRVNRFRGTWLGALPVPLPRYFLVGFDLQKFEAEGVPLRFLNPAAGPDEKVTYPVYLDGQLRHRGWWYYYLATLAYKVPEGTWALGLWALGLLLLVRRVRGSATDEAAMLAVPLVVVAVMSLGTDINLGLRYVLPAFPYAFVAIGRIAPWAAGLGAGVRRPVQVLAGGFLALTCAASALAHPHYLAYFNWASGGTRRGSEHLIDSNLDWGQDLLNLRSWLDRNAPGERVGLAYFGQINPTLFRLRGEPLDWFLPPAAGALPPVNPRWPVEGPARRVEPGLYAISASFVRGLPYAIYDPSPMVPSLYPAWDARQMAPTRWGAFGYFQVLEPDERIGGSIFVYRVDAEEAARLNRLIGAGG